MKAISPILELKSRESTGEKESESSFGLSLALPVQPRTTPDAVPELVQPQHLCLLPLPKKSVVRWKPKEVGPHIVNVCGTDLKLVVQINATKIQIKCWAPSCER